MTVLAVKIFKNSQKPDFSHTDLLATIYSFIREEFEVLSTTFLIVCFLYLKGSTFETRKNVFYSTSKAAFVLEILRP